MNYPIRHKAANIALTATFIFLACAVSLPAQTAADYRTNTPDPLIANLPISIRNLRSRGTDVFFQGIAGYITENSVNDFDKIKKAHDWIALNIRYDTAAYFSGRYPSQSASNVISTGLAVCAGYARVFKYLCDLLEIECEIITGYARGFGISMFEEENPYIPNHDWNKVRIYGIWYLIDTTWDAGYINNDRRFSIDYKTEFLFSDPLIFLHSHFPLNPENQLLDVPITAQEFIMLPRIREDFFRRAANLTPVMRKTTEINGRFFRMSFTSPLNHFFSFSIQRNARGNRIDNIINYSTRGGTHALTLIFQNEGDYGLWFYSSPNAARTRIGIGEFGFRVRFPDVRWGEMPGGARLISPETQNLSRSALTEFKVIKGEYNHFVLIHGTSWRYLTPDGDGYFSGAFIVSSGTIYLAASRTEYGIYETLAEFNVR